MMPALPSASVLQLLGRRIALQEVQVRIWIVLGLIEFLHFTQKSWNAQLIDTTFQPNVVVSAVLMQPLRKQACYQMRDDQGAGQIIFAFLKQRITHILNLRQAVTITSIFFHAVYLKSSFEAPFCTTSLQHMEIETGPAGRPGIFSPRASKRETGMHAVSRK